MCFLQYFIPCYCYNRTSINCTVYKFLFFTLLLTTFFSSCEKETVIRYEGRMEAEFTIPLGLNTIETHYFTIENVPTFYMQNANNFNVDTSGIQNVQSSKGLLRATFNDAEYDFIERVSVYAVSIKDPSLKREMYYLDFSPVNTGRELKMLSSTTNIKDILKEENINLEVRLNFRRFPPGNIRTKIEFGYAVF